MAKKTKVQTETNPGLISEEKIIFARFAKLREMKNCTIQFIGGDEMIKTFKVADNKNSLIIEIDISSGKVIGGQLQ